MSEHYSAPTPRYWYNIRTDFESDPMAAAQVAAQAAELIATERGEAETAESFLATYTEFQTLTEDARKDAIAINNKRHQQDWRPILSAAFSAERVDRLQATFRLVPVIQEISTRLEADTTAEEGKIGAVAQLFYDTTPEGGRAIAKHDMLSNYYLSQLIFIVEQAASSLLAGKDFGLQTKTEIFRELEGLRPLTTRHNAEVLTRVRKRGLLSHIEPERREAALKVIDMYKQWQEYMQTATAFFYYDAPPDSATESAAIAPPSTEEIARWQAEYAQLGAAYVDTVKPYRISSHQLDKQGLRPTATALLRAIRDPRDTLAAPQPEAPQFAKRIIGTLLGLCRLAALPSDKRIETLTDVVAAERAMHSQLTELYDRLAGAGHALDAPVPSLGEDVGWIGLHWRALQSTLSASWPQGRHAMVDIEAVLHDYRTVVEERDRDPRGKLYALARHIGSVALPPESKPHNVTRPIYRLEARNARQGLESTIEVAEDPLLQQRAQLILDFAHKAHETAAATGNQAYGLFFADNTEDKRDRYFVVRCRFDNGDWFVMETLEDNRATYLFPVELLREAHNEPLPDSASELQAALSYNKPDARALGSIGGVRAQVIHQTGWTVASHTSKIEAQMRSLAE